MKANNIKKNEYNILMKILIPGIILLILSFIYSSKNICSNFEFDKSLFINCLIMSITLLGLYNIYFLRETLLQGQQISQQNIELFENKDVLNRFYSILDNETNLIIEFIKIQTIKITYFNKWEEYKGFLGIEKIALYSRIIEDYDLIKRDMSKQNYISCFYSNIDTIENLIDYCIDHLSKIYTYIINYSDCLTNSNELVKQILITDNSFITNLFQLNNYFKKDINKREIVQSIIDTYFKNELEDKSDEEKFDYVLNQLSDLQNKIDKLIRLLKLPHSKVEFNEIKEILNS